MHLFNSINVEVCVCVCVCVCVFPACGWCSAACQTQHWCLWRGQVYLWRSLNSHSPSMADGQQSSA